MAVGLEAFLHLFGHLAPRGPVRRQGVAVVEQFQQRGIVGLFDPVGADREERFVVGREHGDESNTGVLFGTWNIRRNFAFDLSNHAASLTARPQRSEYRDARQARRFCMAPPGQHAAMIAIANVRAIA
jgi:hypothetical protein